MDQFFVKRLYGSKIKQNGEVRDVPYCCFFVVSIDDVSVKKTNDTFFEE